MTPTPLDYVVAELRRRRAALDAYTTTKAHWWPTKAAEWASDQWRYDTDLVAAAELLDVPVPPPPPPDAMRRLAPPERAGLERQLAAAGIDLSGK